MSDAQEKVVDSVVGGFLGHLHLRRYAAYLADKLRGGALVYGDEGAFWGDVLVPGSDGRRRLNHGRLVKRELFTLSEWCPRAPGLYWRTGALQKREEALGHVERIEDEYLVLTPKGNRAAP